MQDLGSVELSRANCSPDCARLLQNHRRCMLQRQLLLGEMTRIITHHYLVAARRAQRIAPRHCTSILPLYNSGSLQMITDTCKLESRSQWQECKRDDKIARDRHHILATFCLGQGSRMCRSEARLRGGAQAVRNLHHHRAGQYDVGRKTLKPSTII